MSEMILLYSMPMDAHRIINDICRDMGINAKKIAKARFYQSLGCHNGSIAIDSSVARYEGEDFEVPMLVFSGVSSRRMDDFLAAYKEKELPQQVLKAVITPTNLGWDAFALYNELCKERQQFNNL